MWKSGGINITYIRGNQIVVGCRDDKKHGRRFGVALGVVVLVVVVYVLLFFKQKKVKTCSYLKKKSGWLNSRYVGAI